MNEELKKLLEKATEAVRRDINHIFEQVSGGKLDKDSSRDLVAYVKLLTDIQKREIESDKEEQNDLASKPESELREIAKALINE